MRFNDAIVGVVLVLFAIAEIAYSTTFPTLHGQAYGSSLFPIIIGCGLIACGLVLIVRGLRARQRSATVLPASITEQADTPDSGQWLRWGDWVHDRARRINMLLVPGLLIAYIALSDSIGFIPLSVTMLSILLYRLGSSLLFSLSIAIIATVLLHVLFARVLLVPLPLGLMLHWSG